MTGHEGATYPLSWMARLLAVTTRHCEELRLLAPRRPQPYAGRGSIIVFPVIPRGRSGRAGLAQHSSDRLMADSELSGQLAQGAVADFFADHGLLRGGEFARAWPLIAFASRYPNSAARRGRGDDDGAIQDMTYVRVRSPSLPPVRSNRIFRGPSTL
jgi:hypothetical protein